jgi:hypothetical protein
LPTASGEGYHDALDAIRAPVATKAAVTTIYSDNNIITIFKALLH